MNVVAFNGSARKDGNTAILIKEVFMGLSGAGIETELVQLAGKPVRGCTACGKCFTAKNRRCVIEGDVINECIAKMDTADGIILGSPVYFANVTNEIKALIGRAGFVAKANGNMLRRKVGASVVAVRRAGAIHVFNSLNYFFFISDSSGVLLLEHWHGPRNRRGLKRLRRNEHHAYPGPEHGLAA
jgi:multimeric flavodoxin WrbA